AARREGSGRRRADAAALAHRVRRVAAAAVAAQAAAGGPDCRRMSCVLHVSDPHFGTEQAPVVAALERLARELRPGLVLLSGDITQRARRAQFAAARAFADRLGVPALLAVPGNHDIPLFNLAARLFAPYGNYARAFGTELEPQFADDDWLVIGVNTTRAARHKNGEVSVAQIERVAARL